MPHSSNSNSAVRADTDAPDSEPEDADDPSMFIDGGSSAGNGSGGSTKNEPVFAAHTDDTGPVVHIEEDGRSVQSSDDALEPDPPGSPSVDEAGVRSAAARSVAAADSLPSTDSIPAATTAAVGVGVGAATTTALPADSRPVAGDEGPAMRSRAVSGAMRPRSITAPNSVTVYADRNVRVTIKGGPFAALEDVADSVRWKRGDSSTRRDRKRHQAWVSSFLDETA